MIDIKVTRIKPQKVTIFKVKTTNHTVAANYTMLRINQVHGSVVVDFAHFSGHMTRFHGKRLHNNKEYAAFIISPTILVQFFENFGHVTIFTTSVYHAKEPHDGFESPIKTSNKWFTVICLSPIVFE